MHLTSSPVDWYAARAAGIAAYALLSGVVLLGLTMAGKKHLRRWPQFAIEDVHRFGGLFVGAFVSIHVLAIAIDAWLPFSVASLVVPLLSRYRPVWVGLGIAGAELLLALAVTNHYRRRLPHRFWRRAHYLNFAVWSAATLHGIGSGTDRNAPWALALYAAASGSVVAALVWRALRLRPRARGVRLPLGSAAGVAAMLLVVLLATGPFRFHPKPWNAATFRESLTGRVVHLNGITRGIVSMTGEGVGLQHVLVRADLLVSPRRVLRTAFQMEYLPSGLRCGGTVTQVHDLGFDASCRTQVGARRVVHARWQESGTDQLADGVITARG